MQEAITAQTELSVRRIIVAHGACAESWQTGQYGSTRRRETCHMSSRGQSIIRMVSRGRFGRELEGCNHDAFPWKAPECLGQKGNRDAIVELVQAVEGARGGTFAS